MKFFNFTYFDSWKNQVTKLLMTNDDKGKFKIKLELREGYKWVSEHNEGTTKFYTIQEVKDE